MVTALAVMTVAHAAGTSSGTAARLREFLDAVPAISTHDHLYAVKDHPAFVETERGRGMNLSAIWRNHYWSRMRATAPNWTPGGAFDPWWAQAKHSFEGARAASFYRYQLPAFRDLYGIDFDRITDEQARDLDRRIFDNYRDERWVYHVITERANIELMFIDPAQYGPTLEFDAHYKFGLPVFRVDVLLTGFHPTEFRNRRPGDNPYHIAERDGLPVRNFDDYLRLADHLFAKAKTAGVPCVKTAAAYWRPLKFEKVTKETAARVFGRPRQALTPREVQDFEDFMLWRMVELSATHDLPLNIHTGNARLVGNNPMLLVELIEANPKTKFILIHGGYPWVSETAAIVGKFPRHVWIDFNFMPVLSVQMLQRGLHEWLDVAPSDRFLWGGDSNQAEGIYGIVWWERRIVAEVLGERVDSGDLTEEDARRIGKQILRDNALKLFPQLEARLWKHTGRKLGPEAR